MKIHRKPLSRYFPATHPKSGEPTYFVEKLYNSIQINFHRRSWVGMLNDLNKKDIPSLQMLAGFVFGGINYKEEGFKHHTIRAGNKVKVGDFIQFYVWSDTVKTCSCDGMTQAVKIEKLEEEVKRLNKQIKY